MMQADISIKKFQTATECRTNLLEAVDNFKLLINLPVFIK